MIESIFGFLVVALSLVLYLLKRSDKKKTDPLEQNRQRYAEADNDIATRDSDSASAHADRDLSELERLQNARGGDSGGSHGNIP